MESKHFVRGRVPRNIKTKIDELITKLGTTSEDLLGRLMNWFAALPDYEQRRIVADLTDEDVLKLADTIRRNQGQAPEKLAAADENAAQQRADAIARQGKTGKRRRKA